MPKIHLALQCLIKKKPWMSQRREEGVEQPRYPPSPPPYPNKLK